MGLEFLLDTLWNCLMEEEVGILGVYGMGGVGKTTLLTQINNRFLSTPHDFDLVIWVLVSKDLRLENVQEEIASRIGLSNNLQWPDKNFSEKAEDIFRILQKKKFVLLLDDIWERVELKEVGVPLPGRQERSKIVFTARSEAVCSKMDAHKRIKVKHLEWEQAWQLFQEKVGEDTLHADPEIPLVAEHVARECDGLPLALITIARAMACRRTLQEWRHALEILRKSSHDLQGMEDKVFLTLKFSYDSLPNDKVKSCFLYCTLFPEEFKIRKSALIEYWICENFWDDHSQVDAVNEGYTIIGTLVHACLLEDEGKYVKMHDMIREMALWIAFKVEKEKENYFVKAGAQLRQAPKIERWKGVRRVSLVENRIEQLTEMPVCPDLLTLFLCGNQRLRLISNGFFRFMKALTVLDLSYTALQDLPAGISELLSLQYLNLARTKLKELTCELLKLKKLKYLNLDGNINLNKVPRHMVSNLPSLQVLRMFNCGIICGLEDKSNTLPANHQVSVEELQSSEDLRVLSVTIRHAFVFQHFFSSDKLLSYTQALHISLEGVMDPKATLDFGDPEEVNLASMVQGRKTQVLNHLSDSVSLRDICFHSLHTVTVSACLYLQDLTWLILAPNLTNLNVSRSRKLEEIISFRKLHEIVDDDGTLNPFSRLKFLKLEDLQQLKSIYWKALTLPLLDEIFVLRCPLLKKLPLNSTSAKGRNVIIQANIDWWDQVQWENDAAEAVFRSCFRENLSTHGDDHT